MCIETSNPKIFSWTKTAISKWQISEILNKVDIEKVHTRIQRESFKPDVCYNQNYSVDPEFEQNFDFEPAQYVEGPNENSKEIENEQDPERNESFVGTPLYVSPEMLNHNLAAYSTDLWALGWIIYQWACGAPPFNGFTEQQIYDKIINKKIFYPEFLDPTLKDLIENLIQINPRDRLGSGVTKENGIEKLKQHKFFEGIDFDTIHTSDVPIDEGYKKTVEVELKAMSNPFDVSGRKDDLWDNMPNDVKAQTPKVERKFTRDMIDRGNDDFTSLQNQTMEIGSP